MRIHDLLLQQVFLVEEEDDRGVLEPGICDDGPEQSFTLLHTILMRAGEDRNTRLGYFHTVCFTPHCECNYYRTRVQNI